MKWRELINYLKFRPMRKLSILIGLFFAFTLAKAQYSGYTAVNDIEQFRAAFTAASQKTNSIKSDFIQDKTLSLLSEKITSRGKFWFRKENKVRMEYTQPFQYLMIINGDNVLVKEGQKENRVSAKSNKLFQQVNRITIDCIQGNVFSNPDFKTKVFQNSQFWLVELSPQAKSLKDFFSTITVTVDRKDYSVSKISMNERSGDNTEIRFINKELNTTIADALFAVK